MFWLEGAWQGAGSSWASDSVRVWGAGWRGQDRDGRGNVQGHNCRAEVTGFVLWEGESLSWGWGQRAAFRQMNWKPSPSSVLGWLPSLTYPLASPSNPPGRAGGQY